MERIPDFLNSLNDEQIRVATTVSGPVLCIAGPGSGKTKTLVDRVVYLIYSGVKPEDYIDPETHNVRSYYPDFLVEDFSGQFTIIEVKGDNMIDDEVVKAKARYASEIASASMMNYRMIKSSEASKGLSDNDVNLSAGK